MKLSEAKNVRPGRSEGMAEKVYTPRGSESKAPPSERLSKYTLNNLKHVLSNIQQATLNIGTPQHDYGKSMVELYRNSIVLI